MCHLIEVPTIWQSFACRRLCSICSMWHAKLQVSEKNNCFLAWAQKSNFIWRIWTRLLNINPFILILHLIFNLFACIQKNKLLFPSWIFISVPPTMNDYINKLSCLFIEQRNYLLGPLVQDHNHIYISKSCLNWVCSVCRSVTRHLYGVKD